MTVTLTAEGETVLAEEDNTEALSRVTVRLLRGVERLPAGATGALVFGGDKEESKGMILVENGRICWAATPGMERRLTDILVSQSRPPLSEAAVKEVYQRCRRDGTPLGAGLVARGVVTPRGLRQALLKHAGEAITQLSRVLKSEGKVSPAWVPNRTRRYDAQFTFTPAEILAAVGARVDEAKAVEGNEALRQALGDGGAGAAFLEGTENELPVAEMRGEQVGVEGLVGLGAWARSAIRRCIPFSSCNLVAVTSHSKSGVIAWMSEGVIYVALCEDRSDLSHLMAQRARARAARPDTSRR